jgi:hypothetical protein
MELFATIEHQSKTQGLQCLVIGGLAVNFYGYSRETADVDLLICRTQCAEWLWLFSSLRYTVDRDAGTFLQLAPPMEGEWPVDLMLVNEATFLPMWKDSREAEMLGARLKIPSLNHLMALKLHALKHTRPHRFLKDFQDLEGLIIVNHLDPNSENSELRKRSPAIPKIWHIRVA